MCRGARGFRAGVALKIPDPGRSAAATTGPLAELRAGWPAYRARRWLVVADGAFALWHLVVEGPRFVLGPLLAERRYGEALGWGLVLASVSVGGLVGGVVVARLGPRRPLVWALAGFAMSAGLPLAVAIGAPLVVVLAAGALAGFGIEVLTGLWDTVLQAHVPPAVVGKLAAYDYLASVGLLPFGYALAAPAAALLGEHGVFGLGVVLTLAEALLVVAVPSVCRLAATPGG